MRQNIDIGKLKYSINIPYSKHFWAHKNKRTYLPRMSEHFVNSVVITSSFELGRLPYGSNSLAHVLAGWSVIVNCIFNSIKLKRKQFRTRVYYKLLFFVVWRLSGFKFACLTIFIRDEKG